MDEMQLLRDFRKEVPEPDPETMRRAYAYATSGQRSGLRKSLRRASVFPLRLRFAVPAAAAVCVAAVCAVIFSGALGGSATHSPSKPVWSAHNASPLFPFLTTNVNRSGQTVSSVETTVQAPWPGATAEIYVLRNPNYETRQFVGGKLVSGPKGQNQIVFQEQTSLTNLTSRPNPPADDKWSSTVTLDPSEWDGGCQNAPYGILVEIGHPAHSAESGSAFFTCNPGSSGGSR